MILYSYMVLLFMVVYVPALLVYLTWDLTWAERVKALAKKVIQLEILAFICGIRHWSIHGIIFILATSLYELTTQITHRMFTLSLRDLWALTLEEVTFYAAGIDILVHWDNLRNGPELYEQLPITRVLLYFVVATLLMTSGTNLAKSAKNTYEHVRKKLEKRVEKIFLKGARKEMEEGLGRDVVYFDFCGQKNIENSFCEIYFNLNRVGLSCNITRRDWKMSKNKTTVWGKKKVHFFLKFRSSTPHRSYRASFISLEQ